MVVSERPACPQTRRWRARQIVKNIPPSDMAQIRAKVAALEVLQGLRKDWGCQRGWARDYLSSVRARRGWRDPKIPPRPAARPHPTPPSPQASENPGLALPFARRVQALRDKVHFGSVLFSGHVRKVRGSAGPACPRRCPPFVPPPHFVPAPQINRFNKSRDRAILITDQHLYKLEPRQQYRVMRALPLSTVSVPSTGWHRGGRPGCPCPLRCPHVPPTWDRGITQSPSRCRGTTAVP